MLWNTTRENLGRIETKTEMIGGETYEYEYEYDPAGRLTFEYDQNNRLVRVSRDGTVLGEYSYDGQGRRVKKLASGTVTLYHYDYAGNLISETDGNGGPLRDYVYLNGERIAMRIYGTQAGWYYFVNDHLGTPHKIADSSGNVVWAAAYLPFGEAQIITGTVANNLRFPGQYYDAETGLHYNWNRYYDPKTGRYLTPDPIGLAGGVNPYVYVMANPLNWIDSNGLTRMIFIVLSGTLIVDPEIPGKSPYLCQATSGKGENMNDPAAEDLEDKGPIPSGSYFVDMNKLSNPHWLRDIYNTLRYGDWGDWNVPIAPCSGTDTHNRKGFYIHGGAIPGSAGCIDVGGGVFGNEKTDSLLRDMMNDPDGIISFDVYMVLPEPAP